MQLRWRHAWPHLYRASIARRPAAGLGNDAATHWRTCWGAQTSPWPRWTPKPSGPGGATIHCGDSSGLDGPAAPDGRVAHDLAVIFRAAMGVRCSRRSPPSRRRCSGDNGDHPIVNQDELLQRYPALSRQDGFTNAAARRSRALLPRRPPLVISDDVRGGEKGDRPIGIKPGTCSTGVSRAIRSPSSARCTLTAGSGLSRLLGP